MLELTTKLIVQPPVEIPDDTHTETVEDHLPMTTNLDAGEENVILRGVEITTQDQSPGTENANKFSTHTTTQAVREAPILIAEPADDDGEVERRDEEVDTHHTTTAASREPENEERTEEPVATEDKEIKVIDIDDDGEVAEANGDNGKDGGDGHNTTKGGDGEGDDRGNDNSRHNQHPLSNELEERLRDELKNLEERFENEELFGEPTKALVSFEINGRLEKWSMSAHTDKRIETTFGYSREQILANRESLELSREQIRQELGTLEPQNAEEAARQSDWIAQVDRLSDIELVMYQLYNQLSTPTLDVSTRVDSYPESANMPGDPLQFVFGQALHQGGGWYDNPSIFEFRTTPTTPSSAVDYHQDVMSGINTIYKPYGIAFHSEGEDIDFSVWAERDGKYVTTHSVDPVGLTFTSWATAGILEAMRDSDTAIRDPSSLRIVEREELLLAGPLRLSAPLGSTDLRVIPGLFEARTSAINESGSPSLAVAALMTGYAYGVLYPEQLEAQTDVVNIPIIRTTETFDRATDFHLLRALQNSNIVAGHFELNEDYAAVRSVSILRSIVSDNIASENDYQPIFSRDTGVSLLQDLVRTISVGEGGKLQHNEERFNDILSTSPVLASYAGDARLGERLGGVHYEGEARTIWGKIDHQTPALRTMHNDLDVFFMQSLPLTSFIDHDVLQAVRDERSDAISKEQAAATYLNTYREPGDNFDPDTRASAWMTSTLGYLGSFSSPSRNETLDIVAHQVQQDILERGDTVDDDTRTAWQGFHQQLTDYIEIHRDT